MPGRFPFPTAAPGWYAIAASDEIAAGAAIPARAFGRELVIWRGGDGAIRVAGAHCPHLGAHLGHGGRVEGGTLTCPFHGWCFDAGGRCVSIPYAAKIPPRAQLDLWPARELGGLVFTHFHPDGQAPAWEPPAWPESGSPAWARSRVFHWRFRSHVQEIAENVVDAAHFLSVHRTASFPETRVRADGPVLASESRMRQATPRGEVDARIDATFHGLGLLRLRFHGIVDTVALAAPTPVDDERVELRFVFFVSRAGGAGPEHGVGASLIEDVRRQVDADIPIWEHKIYRERPLLCAADEPIVVLRRWAARLYA